MKKYSTLLFFSLISLCAINAQTYVNLNATGSNDGSTWANAYSNLDDALNNTNSGDIWIATGTYNPAGVDSSATFRISNSISLYGGFTGTESNINERDLDQNPTILSGDINGDDVLNDFTVNKGDNVQHVLTVDSLINNAVIINGLEIDGGNTSDNPDILLEYRAGGGILSYSTLDVRHCKFSENFSRSGACIYLSSASGGGNGTVIDNCTFISNRSSSQSAGIMLQNLDAVSINNCSFSSNQTSRGTIYPLRCTNVSIDSCVFNQNISITTDGFGGAFFSWNTVGLSFTNCGFSNNQAGNGAAMYVDGRELTPALSKINFENVIFTANRTTDWGGGCIYNWRSSYDMSECVFNGNMGTNGGCIYNGGEGKEIQLYSNVFSGNSLSDFGGAMLCYGADSNYEINYCEFVGNSAGVSGGSLIVGFDSNAVFNNCEFSMNQAQFGGAIYSQNNFTDLTLNNCYFESNIASNNGGGVNYAAGGDFLIDKCEFVDNEADVGAALNVSESTDTTEYASFMMVNSKVDFNNAGTQAAGINLNDIDAVLYNNKMSYNLNLDGLAGGAFSINVGDNLTRSVSLINNTLANNFANIGSGIATFTSDVESVLELNMQNNILFNPGGAEYEIEAGTPTVTSNGGNVVRDNTAIDLLDDPTDQNQVSDIMFINAQSDFHLTINSPAVDAGNSTGAPLTDLEGLPRVNEVDAGSFEFQMSSTQETLVDPEGILDIYPNPVKSDLNFELSNDWNGELSVRVYDLRGQEILKQVIRKSDTNLNLSINVNELSMGVYDLLISDGNELVVKQFLKM